MESWVESSSIASKRLDHHGLIASICGNLGIKDKINARISQTDDRRVVSCGTSVIAMILNGLGFTNRRLYLTSQFFENKPVSHLLDESIEAKDLTDHTLGHALDEIAEYGSTELFSEVAFEIALEQDLLGGFNHLDSTSLSVHGNYEGYEGVESVQITHGYSKDHRPDLKQVVLSLVTQGPSDFPIWMEPLDGNSSDKESFQKTIRKMESFKKQLQIKGLSRWICDSALYSQSHLLQAKDYLWVCRVPESIKECKEWVSKHREDFPWEDLGNGYEGVECLSEYGGVKQRWFLIYSQQAADREQKTLQKQLEQQEKTLTQALWHLGNETFNCEKDARKAIEKLKKKYPYFDIEFQIEALENYAKPGRPKPNAPKVITGFRIQGQCSRNSTVIEQRLHSKGRFVLATNDFLSGYGAQEILTDYLGQQSVERGFRFLKDPWFMVDSIFLKSPKRIEALMMVMTLCLLVYNVAQYRLRKTLVEQKETLPNQLGKAVQNPTMRWIFQIMEGIDLIALPSTGGDVPTRVVTNLNEVRKKIICLFGKQACRMYGLIPNNQNNVLGT